MMMMMKKKLHIRVALQINIALKCRSRCICTCISSLFCLPRLHLFWQIFIKTVILWKIITI